MARTEAEKQAQAAYIKRSVRIQVVLNPINKEDAALIEQLTAIEPKPSATMVKGILHRYFALQKAFAKV